MTFYGKDKIWQECFVEPSKECDELRFVSGYFSMEMFEKMPSLTQNIKWIYGMAYQEDQEGMLKGDISKVEKSLHIPLNEERFHEKLYVWLKDGEPKVAFVGSANFTEKGLLREKGFLGKKQSEILYKVEDLQGALNHLDGLFQKTKPLSELDADEKQTLIDKHEKKKLHQKEKSRIHKKVLEYLKKDPDMVKKILEEIEKKKESNLFTRCWQWLVEQGQKLCKPFKRKSSQKSVINKNPMHGECQLQQLILKCFMENKMFDAGKAKIVKEIEKWLLKNKGNCPYIQKIGDKLRSRLSSFFYGYFIHEEELESPGSLFNRNVTPAVENPPTTYSDYTGFKKALKEVDMENAEIVRVGERGYYRYYLKPL